MKKEDWGNEIQPYDEFEDVRPRHRGRDDWDEDEEHQYTRRDPNLDPGFSSWEEYYRWKYG